MTTASPNRSTIGGFAGVAAFVLGLLVFSLGGLAPAGAHSALIVASPSPAQEVGGEVTIVDLVFNGGIEDSTVFLEDPNGERIDGELELKAKNWLRLVVDPLETEGQYIVRFSFISEDTDPVDSAYAFKYAVDGPDAIPLSSSTDLLNPQEGPGAMFWVVSVALVLGLALFAGLMAERLRKTRMARIAQDEGSGDASTDVPVEP